jgi:hypothetical protein
MKRILAEPDLKQKIETIGLIPFDTPGIEDLRAYRKAEQEKWEIWSRSSGWKDRSSH